MNAHETRPLGELIRDYRLKHRLSWERLGTRLQMSAAALWKIANGKAKPRETTEYWVRHELAKGTTTNGGGKREVVSRRQQHAR